MVRESAIEEIELYRSGAVLYRTVQFNLEKGINVCTITSLPNDLTEDKVFFKVPRGVKVLNCLFINDTKELLGGVSRGYKDLLERQKELSVRIQLLEYDQKLHEQSMRDNFSTTEKSMKSFSSRGSLKSVLEGLFVAKQELSAVLEQINILKATEKLSVNRTKIQLQLQSSRSGLVELSLMHLTDAAGWTPKYQIFADRKSEKVRMTLTAQVYQTTGESWEKVKLSLNTGSDLSYYKFPEFKSEPFQSMRPVMMRSARTMAADFDGANGGVHVKDAENIRQFQLNYPCSLETGDKCIYFVQEEQHDVKFVYQTMLFDGGVYATATFGEHHSFINASATVFFNDVCVGNTYLNSAEKTLTLGTAQLIHVTKTKEVDSTKELMLGGSKTSSGFNIFVKNGMDKCIELIIIDRLPVSEKSAVVVMPLQLCGADIDMTTGKLTWSIALQPLEEKILTVKFSTEDKST